MIWNYISSMSCHFQSFSMLNWNLHLYKLDAKQEPIHKIDCYVHSAETIQVEAHNSEYIHTQSCMLREH